MANRLQHATSPYLLQHAHNPVDWHPWEAEALARARAEDKPIFLSIGYSACHWCHVMERESFEDPATARQLNRSFVCIKVDREERPDIDSIYMEAVQALAGRGGWPMSVWLTPDLEPFFGGTYFPPTPRYGMPSFGQLLDRIAELWRERRADLAKDARTLAASLARQAEVRPGAGLPGTEVFEDALHQLRATFDARWGGFGPAPKFPAHLATGLLLRRGVPEDRVRVRRTLDAMHEGGMFDHLGGGFARYSVDERWLVPHFEKMLYDNALLACAYLEGFQAFGDDRDAQVARETLDYLLRDLRDDQGGFHSAEDADSEGEEGRFYVFTPDEVKAVLGAEDGTLFCEAFGITQAGCFEHGTSVLHRFAAPGDLAQRHGLESEALEARLDALRARLRVHRDRRVRPAKDDKVLTAWNGLALSAFARAARVLEEPRYREAAVACAAFLRRELCPEGPLLRTWRKGQAHTPAFLEDYGALILGLVDLYEATFDDAWLDWAEDLAARMRAAFEDGAEGGFFAASEGPDLIFRTKPGWDGALPSANTLAALALLRLGRHRRREAMIQATERTLVCFADRLRKVPRGGLGMLAVLDELLRPEVEATLDGPLEDPRSAALQTELSRSFTPGLTLRPGDPSASRPAVRLCTGARCLPPLETPEALRAALAAG